MSARKTISFIAMELPQPQSTSTPLLMRVLAFLLVAIGGVLSMTSCYAIAKMFGLGTLWQALALIVGAIIGAVGMGIIAYLTIQSMAEWPEAKKKRASKASVTEDRLLQSSNLHKSTDQQ